MLCPDIPMRVIQGRVALFSIGGCPYCRKAKTFLSEQLRLPYSDINLDTFPERRSEAFKRSGKRTVPQIFFNGVHVGGCDDLMSKTPQELDALIEEVTSNPAGPDAPTPPDPQQYPLGTSLGTILMTECDDEVQCETDRFVDLIDQMQDPVGGVVTKDRNYFLRRYPNCFVGSSAVDWLVLKGHAADRAAAVQLGNVLMERFFFHHVTHEHLFKDEKLFYRFLADMKTRALNRDEASSCEPEDPSKLAENIRRAILSLYDHFLSPDGTRVDYGGIALSPAFARFRQLTAQLQRVNLQSMNRAEKIAFFINIYNALVIHATVVKGQPKTAMQRSKFFTSVSYLIGGLEFTLNDIENGVLRANRRAPFGFFKPFSRTDPRHAIALHFHEPRIHFALVCGAKSCPAIKTYQASHVHQQLTEAAQGFFESPDNFRIKAKSKTVVLSKILDWYAADFGKNSIEITSWVSSFLAPEPRQQLQELIDGGKISLEFTPYDWSINSQD
ncbi:MAG: DUF547 domain-containing protein [archaeon]|nr:DUF547 domain-containing protein [archaeon]